MKVKRLLVGIVAIFLAFLSVSDVFAKKLISEDKLYYYGQNGIYFYNGDAEKCNVTEGGNQNYAGAVVWSEAELSAIHENQAVYEKAASDYGFPWQVLAVLHSMETGLKRYNPSNGQGVYQLYSYTGGGNNDKAFLPAGAIAEEEFARQTEIAASVVSNMVGDLNDADNVKRLFFKFNGTSSRYIEKALAMGFSEEEARNGEGSPYVMNRYDARRDPTSGEMDSAWPGRYVSDGNYDPSSTSQVFGAFVKYEALVGNSYCSDSGGEIVETALLLSWEGHSHAKDDPKPEYVTAMKEVGSYKSYCNDSGCAPPGASCDVFVSAVMRYSGSDPSFPLTGPAVQKEYMQSHPELYTSVEASDVSDLEPGDILVTTENGRHIYIYLGDGMQASASFNDRTGEHYEGVYLSDSGTGNGTRHYSVFRRIN